MINDRGEIIDSNETSTHPQEVYFADLGRMPYRSAWDLQTSLSKKLIDQKRSSPDRKSTGPHYFILCEHPPVFTLGKSGSADNLRISENDRRSRHIDFFEINRGGDITFHGPGQVVGYPILDLDRFFTDVHKYVRTLEEGIIRLLDDYNLQGHRLENYTGVWIKDRNAGYRKICAIGVHLSRWVTMHGFALNVSTDLEYFEHIIPCGINEKDKTVTSIEQELDVEVSSDDVKQRLAEIYAALFGFEYLYIDKQKIEGAWNPKK